MYAPGIMPDGDLRRYLTEELAKISAAIQIVALGQVEKAYQAPPKPRDGMVRLADGSKWNPGSGAGIYYFNAGSWVFLG